METLIILGRQIRASAFWRQWVGAICCKRHRVVLAVTLSFLTAHTSLAERFLTAAQAQKLCFPHADRFEERVLRLSPEQLTAFEKRTGSKVSNRGNRFWLAWQGTNWLGTFMFDQVIGKHELIDYGVALSLEGKVMQVEILEYREHYGSQIRGTKWRDQFKGKTANAPLKLNDDIYNISGATLSCRHVTEGVRRVLATYDLVVRPRLLSAVELPNSGTAPKP